MSELFPPEGAGETNAAGMFNPSQLSGALGLNFGHFGASK